MFHRMIILTITLVPCVALAQSAALGELRRLAQDRELAKGSATTAASTSALNIEVSKTASVNGQNVCGAIRIKNTGTQTATVSGIADSLEVHFPQDGSLAGLPLGSTRNWYKVADVPIAPPGPIASRATATINYCFPLCTAAASPGANSMRNVVAVTVTNQAGGVKSVTTRSISFVPPVLDCQACCNRDGSCTDTLPADCTASNGTPHGPDTKCATTRCCAATGESGACSGGAPCCDDNATCDSGTCCLRIGNPGCEERSDCCEEDPDATVICDAGKCCAPNRAPDSCHDSSDCCDATATCNGGTCCIGLGETGCTNLVGNDCCPTFGSVICEAGKCCAPTGASNSCSVDTDCCDPDTTCNGGTCCVRIAATGCEDRSDCCEEDPGATVICEAGKCCAPNRASDSCHDATDCCDENAICNGSMCCIALGDSGCTNLVGNDCCPTFGSAICEAGRCCAPTGATDSCNVDSDCCDPSATCHGGTCCVGTGVTGCEDVSDCCDDRSGMACEAEKCCVRTDVDFHSACSDPTDCCQLNATCDIHGACCIATGTTGCATDSHCCNSSATCQAGTGKCCAENSAPGACRVSSDCCDGNAICNLNSTCCVPDLRPCDQPSDCCSGLCVGGACEGIIGP